MVDDCGHGEGVAAHDPAVAVGRLVDGWDAVGGKYGVAPRRPWRGRNAWRRPTAPVDYVYRPCEVRRVLFGAVRRLICWQIWVREDVDRLVVLLPAILVKVSTYAFPASVTSVTPACRDARTACSSSAWAADTARWATVVVASLIVSLQCNSVTPAGDLRERSHQVPGTSVRARKHLRAKVEQYALGGTESPAPPTAVAQASPSPRMTARTPARNRSASGRGRPADSFIPIPAVRAAIIHAAVSGSAKSDIESLVRSCRST